MAKLFEVDPFFKSPAFLAAEREFYSRPIQEKVNINDRIDKVLAQIDAEMKIEVVIPQCKAPIEKTNEVTFTVMDFVHEKWSSAGCTDPWSFKHTLPVEAVLVNRRIRAIAEKCVPVEKQVFGLGKVGSVAKDVEDMMPMLQATVFDTRLIVDSIKGYMPAVESTLKGGASVANMINLLTSSVSGMVDVIDSGVSECKKMIKKLIAGVEAHPLESFIIVACVGVPMFAFSAKCRSVGWLSMVLLPFVGAAFTGHLRTMIEYVVCNYDTIFKFPNEDRKGVRKQVEMPQFSEQSAVYLLLVAMSLIVMGSIPNSDKMNKVVKGFGDVGRNVSGISQGVRVAREFSSKLTEMFFELMSDANMTDNNLILISKMAEFDVVAWMKKVHEYSLEENKYTVFAHPTKHKEIRLLYEEAMQMIKTLSNCSLPIGLSRQMEKTIELARKLRNDLNSFKGLGCRRFDPFHVSFSGVPGVGKSGMTNKFVDNWMDALGEPKIDRYYARTANSPYWSGYQNQALVTYDDFTAIISQGEASDVNEMIAIKTNCPLMLNMASIEEKGRHFVSRYIVSSTNTEYIGSDSGLRCADAFHRRRDCLIRCVFAPGYGPKDDPTTKDAGEDENELDGSASHMRFIFLNPKINREGENMLFGGKAFRYHEMFSLIVEKTAAHMVNQHELQNKILGDGFGKTFASRMKVDITELSDEDREGMTHVENYYRWQAAFKEARAQMRPDAVQEMTPEELHRATTVEVQARMVTVEKQANVWAPEDDPHNHAERFGTSHLGFNWEHSALVPRCMVDEKDNLIFFHPKDAEKYEAMIQEDKVVLVEKVKARMRAMIETNDVAAVMQHLPTGTRRLMADALLETQLVVTIRDQKGNPVEYDIVCTTDDMKDLWYEWDKHHKIVFTTIKVMYEHVEEQRKEWSIKEKAIGETKSYFMNAWNLLTTEKRQAMRVAYAAGGIVVLASAIFGAYKWWNKEEEADHMPDHEFYMMPSGDKLAARASIEVEGGNGHISGDPSTLRGKRNFNRRVRMECQYLLPCKHYNSTQGCKHEEARGGNPEDCTNLHMTYAEFNTKEAREEVLQAKIERGLVKPKESIVVERGQGHGSGDPSTKFGKKKASIAMEGGNANVAELFPDIEAGEIARQSESGFSFLKDNVWYQRKGMDMTEVTVKKQWCSDPNAETLIDNKISENIGILNWRGHYKMACLFITDNLLLAPKHFFQPMKEGAMFDVMVRGHRYEQVYDPNCFELVDVEKKPHLSDYVKDQGVYWCSARVQGCRSLMNNLATNEDHMRFKPGRGLLVNAGLNIGAVKLRERYLENLERTCHVTHDPSYEKIMYKMDDNTTETQDWGWHWVVDGYRYTASTVNGECGSVVVQFNPNTNGKIVGMHVAGSNAKHYGYSEAVIKEKVEGAISRLHKRFPTRKQCGNFFEPLAKAIDEGLVYPDVYTNTLKELPEGDIMPIGSVHMKAAIFTNTSSDIHASPIKEYLGSHKTEPAILWGGDSRLRKEDGTMKKFDPLISGISKYGKNTKPFDHRDIAIVKGFLFDKLSMLKSTRGKMEELTLSECINGIPGMEYYDQMNMVTSEGAPWVKGRPRGEHGKSWMFKKNGEVVNGREYREIDEEATMKNCGRSLLEAYETRMSEARAGRRVHSISTECTKDERRSLKKIYENPNTRTFTILPVDFNMSIRTLFMDFVTLIQGNREKLPPQVGINPESVEWTEMYMRLTSNASMGFAGDYKNFDGQTCPELFQMVAELVNMLYDDGEENATARCVLMSEAYSRLSMCKDTLFNVKRGMPSGFPLTVIVNSIVNWAYLMLAWLALAREHAPQYASCSDFHKFVECVVYGDDNCVAINFEVIQWYNLKTVAKWLRQFEIVLTDSAKRPAEEADPVVPISTMTFLKREFRRSPRDSFFIVAPLEKQSIEERVRWVRESSELSDDEMLAENINNSMRDAYYHGEEYFTAFKKLVNSACVHARKEHLCSTLQFAELDRSWHCAIKGLSALIEW